MTLNVAFAVGWVLMEEAGSSAQDTGGEDGTGPKKPAPRPKRKRRGDAPGRRKLYYVPKVGPEPGREAP